MHRRMSFKQGFIYCEYAMIPFEMAQVEVQTLGGKKVIDDYEELKEWWENEE